MKFLKLPGRKEVHVWTPLLAARGDMQEVDADGNPYQAPVLGIGIPVKLAIAEETPVEPIIEPVAAKEEKAIVTPALLPKKPPVKKAGRPKKATK